MAVFYLFLLLCSIQHSHVFGEGWGLEAELWSVVSVHCTDQKGPVLLSQRLAPSWGGKRLASLVFCFVRWLFRRNKGLIPLEVR